MGLVAPSHLLLKRLVEPLALPALDAGECSGRATHCESSGEPEGEQPLNRAIVSNHFCNQTMPPLINRVMVPSTSKQFVLVDDRMSGISMKRFTSLTVRSWTLTP